MKKLILPFASLVIISGCNNKSETSTTTGSDSVADINKTEQIKDASAEMETKKEELSSLTPYTIEQMKALLPKDLSGTAATDVDISATMGTSVANASYKINDSTEIEVSIIDCAGPAGAGIYNLQYVSMFGFEEDDEEEYTKVIEFNGGKAFEHCNKTKPDCTLTYFSGGRFLVTLEGENVPADQLKAYAKNMMIR